MPTVLLVDNGSRRPESTLALRQVAAQLSAATGQTIIPVSLLHSDAIDPALLAGQPALTLIPFLRQQVLAGQRQFIFLPLFFGPSQALTQFIPAQLNALRQELGLLHVSIADVICPLPVGEPVLVDMLMDYLQQTGGHARDSLARVIVVDHGSPTPQVTAVRTWLAGQLQTRLEGIARVNEAVMERRSGAQYDFNGPLLQTVLEHYATHDPQQRLTVALLFFFAGRHAGPEGDIATLCQQYRTRAPGLQLTITPLIGQHHRLLEILAARLQRCQSGTAWLRT